MGACAESVKRKATVAVPVGNVIIGGGAPVVVQAMTDTPTADAAATAAQVAALAEAGAEVVRLTVDSPKAAAAVPAIAARLRDGGCTVPLVGDFHFIGHQLLADFPGCAQILDKYRINPGNIGSGEGYDAHFAAFCRIAVEHNKAIRIGVNVGSLNEALLARKLAENEAKAAPEPAEAVLSACMIASALESTDLALRHGLRKEQIVLSAKSSTPRELIALYRELAERTEQPLHLGLTEAGMGMQGVVWSTAAMAVLLEEGIGDTIRVSLTPRPGGDRCEEVCAACEMLQALGLRRFAPKITACPGCGRTNGQRYKELAEATRVFIGERLPAWRKAYPGVEHLHLAVMGCVVNGPGESRAADMGISLPGKGEGASCPVYVDGVETTRLEGDAGALAKAFHALIEAYVARRFGGQG